MRTNSHQIRRLTTGTSLCLAAILLIVALFVDPGTWGDDREAVSFQDNPGLAQLQSGLYHWSYLLMVFAVIGLAHFTRQRLVLLGHLTAGLAAIGWINLSALLLTDPIAWYFGARHAPEEAERLTNEMLDQPNVIFGFMIPGPFLALIATALLMVVLWRAGFVRGWLPVVFTLAWVGSFVAPYGPVTIPLWSVVAGVLTYLGVRIIRMSDDAYAAYDRPAVVAPSDAPTDKATLTTV
ncbi:hypothetical protein N802_00790 [Knoellia sinensis KCTC 19936]|uniref:DUF4386 family protein n=1 Tax=Knoellia sinensis KCTC 19936 TaxID=1385520 RepID=A0A0A0JE07_9MICO|nr:hypothetical protein [Knoellia sinensis]KGN34994.1 hypothetical protein N802_00790 [Knoellia sinensis KCTC 19936]